MPIRKKRIETIVRQVLKECHAAQPPVPIERIAKQCGLTVRFQPLESNLSGFLYPTAPGAVIGVNTYHPRVRQRFTIAHEIGHFMLNHADTLHVDREFLMRNAHVALPPTNIDEMSLGVIKRSEVSSQGVNVDEIEANYFAAELLMPGDFLASDLKDIEGIDITDEDFVSDLARRYDVSVQALVLRLINLGYVQQ